MPDQAVAEKVQEMFDKLLGDKAEAEAFSENPEEWVQANGYSDLPADAVAECGVQYGSGASAVASSGGGGGGYAPGVEGVVQAAAPAVYNTYIEDNSITNNIANNGILDFDQQVIQGDGNVAAGGDLINTGQVQTGDGIQSGGDTNINDSAVATGGGDATNIDDNDTTYNDSFNTDVDTTTVTDSQGVNVDQSEGAGDTSQAAAGSDDDGVDI
jgi:hypothetical protein